MHEEDACKIGVVWVCALVGLRHVCQDGLSLVEIADDEVEPGLAKLDFGGVGEGVAAFGEWGAALVPAKGGLGMVAC